MPMAYLQVSMSTQHANDSTQAVLATPNSEGNKVESGKATWSKNQSVKESSPTRRSFFVSPLS